MAKSGPKGHIIQHNASGLPDSLKSGMEALTGADLSNVRVHRNSHAPAAIGVQSYSNGLDIYLKPGEEKLLAHELTHVVQQSQGRTQPTTSMKSSDAMRTQIRAENLAKQK
jgi:hypothetical protein